MQRVRWTVSCMTMHIVTGWQVEIKIKCKERQSLALANYSMHHSSLHG